MLHSSKSEHTLTPFILSHPCWRYRKLRPERLGDSSKVTQQVAEAGSEPRESGSRVHYPRDSYVGGCRGSHCGSRTDNRKKK